MNILGAIIAFIVMLLLGVPIVLLTVTFNINVPFVPVLANLAQPLLAGFLIVYIFAVVSSITFAAIGEFITVRAANFRTRWVWTWVLSLVYLAVTAGYLILVAPFLLRCHLIAVHSSANSVVSGALSFGWLLLVYGIIAHFIVVLLGYIAASIMSPAHDQYAYSTGEMFVRGLLIGSNAGMNLLLGTTAIGGVLAVYLGPWGIVIGCGAGIILAVGTLLTAGMPTGSEDANSAIKRIVGWMSWMMPTNWLATSLGWVLYLISALFSILLGWTPFYGLYLINAIIVEWPYGTLFIEGGIASNLWLQGPMKSRGAYNLGLFAFMHANTVPEVEPLTGTVTAVGLGNDPDFGDALIFDTATRKHECGHNLNLTAFGSFFHFVGAVDENVGQFARKANAYAERLADSNVPGPTGSQDAFHPVRNPKPQTPLPFWTV